MIIFQDLLANYSWEESCFRIHIQYGTFVYDINQMFTAWLYKYLLLNCLERLKSVCVFILYVYLKKME